ncbi:energy-coupling factor transporter ATPase [Treponema vincentii]|uniref:energy-coupling factor transporter ATPase n=1 Tax=Treponema vincentii TaxID=69710 RepID=UPI001E2FE457|nr:energy-coupling factor transporter ATPase [Treponema vincentii]
MKDGEFVVLCGESGCGKTTVTRLINGLAPHFYEGEMSGSVMIGDVCVNTENLSDIAALTGSVFQNPKSQFFNLDTTGELVFGCENLGIPREQIQQRLEKTKRDLQLDNLMDRDIFELSGGEKQQIACASCYTADPRVFVLDEPSSNLDKRAIQRLHRMLVKIKAAGKTVVIAEHRLYYLMDVADRFIYMRGGRIERIFTRDEMKALSESDLTTLGLRLTDMQFLAALARKEDAAQETPVKSSTLPETQPVSKPALEALDVTCGYGSTRVLDIERLALPEHSIVALIGDNGSGKSTFAQALAGLIPSNGSIAVGGAYLTAEERSKRSFMVMQDVNRQLFADSVLEEVMMNTGASAADAEAVLARLGILELKDRHPASLSGGQKQRTAIASALCAKKDLLIFDEPTSGLDRRGMERFGSLLRELQTSAALSLVITHDPELIMRCCTHILHIENGRVLAFYPLNQAGIERVSAYFLQGSDENTSRKRDKQSSIGKILQYAGAHRRTIYKAALCMTLGAAASIIPYLLVYTILEQVLNGSVPTLAGSGKMLAGILLAEIVYAVLYMYGFQLSHRAAYNTLENIRRFLQENLERKPLGKIREMGSGAIKKLFIDDIESIELLLAHMIPEGIANLTVAVFALVFLLVIDWQLALVTCVVIALGISVSGQMYRVGIDQMGSYFAAAKRLNNTIIEYVNGMEVVRVFNRQDEFGERFASSVTAYRDFALSWYKVSFPWMALYGSLFSNILLYSLPFGTLLILLGQLTLTRYILIICLSFGIAPLLLRCMSFIGAVPQASYKIQALEKAFDYPELKTGTAPFSGTGHDIEFRNVRFAYKDLEVLKDVSFTAQERQMTALVGASGSGKSTAAKLLVHYYDVSGGEVLIGGQNIREMSLEALNEQIAYVSQDVFLFNKSIADNIRIGKKSATDDEVIAAAKKAQADEFIRELPDGYATLAGEAGSKLSGGQRQRIAFARAILKDAPIVILDEATAFIDPENEQKMNQAISEIVRDKTIIVIAHKMKSIMNANRIIVLKDGRIAASGCHAELIKTSPEYQNLWRISEETADWTVRGK